MQQQPKQMGMVGMGSNPLLNLTLERISTKDRTFSTSDSFHSFAAQGTIPDQDRPAGTADTADTTAIAATTPAAATTGKNIIFFIESV